MKKYVFLIPLLALAIFLRAQTTEQPTMAFPFQMTLLRPDSTAVASEKVLLKGKPTILAFWLTTCMPCLAEFEAYSQKYASWQQAADFQLVGISIDFPNRFQQIAPMIAEKKWPFPIYWDRERVFKRILPGGLNGLPQMFIFDKNGQLVWQHKGFKPGLEDEIWAKVLELSK
jgi:cytochrome c biogenesis protein CcmG/thiol:disulfide interchange protein DsbE